MTDQTPATAAGRTHDADWRNLRRIAEAVVAEYAEHDGRVSPPTEMLGRALSRPGTFWAAEWHSISRLDGDRRHILYDNLYPKLFRRRADCRAWIEEKFGYIRERQDLRAEPHGWRVPQAILVTVCRVTEGETTP